MKKVRLYESFHEIEEASGDFAGWIAIDHKGTRLEIKADEAKDLWAAKKLAIAKLRVPKSKEGLLAIAPAVEESVVNESDVRKKINRRGDVDGLIVTHSGNEYEIVYSGDFSMGGAVQPYGIVMPGDDVVSFLGKDKKAKSIWKQLKPKVDKFVKSNESVEVNEGRSINKIKKDYDKVITDMADKVKSWKDCKASGDAKGEAACLAELKDLTAKKKALMSELDDAVGLKDIDAQLAESLNERRSWGTFGTPEAKKVIKDMDKTWDKFSKTVSKAHADFRKEVKAIINSEDGGKSGITDSEGGSYITGMVNNFARKEFMMDDLGDISRYKYMIDLYESNETNEDEAK